MRRASFLGLALLAAPAWVLFTSCSPKDETAGPAVDAAADGADAATDTAIAFDVPEDAAPVDTGPPPIADPKTCEEAALSHSYVGCEFWPTVTANIVWESFDFTAVVANAGDEDARITVTGPGGFSKEMIVGAGRLVKVFLPWVKELKGPEGDACGSASSIDTTVRVDKGAYHLLASKPVTVYQFSALEYEGKGGPPGKSWADCKGNTPCDTGDGFPTPIGCYSFTNDASLLLPTTAMTGNYRLAGVKGIAGSGGYAAITGTKDGTDVTVSLGLKNRIFAGGGIPFVGANGTVTFKLNAGDVMQLLGGGNDLAGALVKASKPVQVVMGVPCITSPVGTPACDHVEESVFPAETLGKKYVVTGPTGPDGGRPGHQVRLVGNVDGTKLTYDPAPPAKAPTTLDAGQVVDLGVVSDDFVVTGDHEFVVVSEQLGGQLADPSSFEGAQKGDPSASLFPSVEQFRKKYVFLAPDDYLVAYVDVVGPEGVKLLLDGKDAGSFPMSVGASGYEVHRIKLDKGPFGVGAHTLTADKPVGIQVLGYGLYTSFQYPGGLNLLSIASVPAK